MLHECWRAVENVIVLILGLMTQKSLMTKVDVDSYHIYILQGFCILLSLSNGNI